MLGNRQNRRKYIFPGLSIEIWVSSHGHDLPLPAIAKVLFQDGFMRI
jgi:hypothetical protein